MRSADEEARDYFSDKDRRRFGLIGKNVPERLRKKIERLCDADCSPLKLRLTGAWVLQQLQRPASADDIEHKLDTFVGRPLWWKKQRKAIALLQVASFANQRKRYYGWNNIL